MNRNEMCLTFPSYPENESFARVVAAAFLVRLSPTLSEVADVKTAVSEAVTNAIVHGYEGIHGPVTLRAFLTGRNTVTIEVSDEGKGIANIDQAMEPFYTTQA